MRLFNKFVRFALEYVKFVIVMCACALCALCVISVERVRANEIGDSKSHMITVYHIRDQYSTRSVWIYTSIICVVPMSHGSCGVDADVKHQLICH